MAITRVINWWRHDFASAPVCIHVTSTDDVEGTTVDKLHVVADTILPGALAAWEAARATALNATLAP